MNPVNNSLQTAILNRLYQVNTRGNSSALTKAREILKDIVDVSPSLTERVSSLEQAAENLLEAKRQASGMNRAGAAERISSIKERLKLLKLFSQLGDKKIAREAARLAGEINKTLRLYKAALREAESEGSTESPDTGSSSQETSESSQASDTSQATEAGGTSNAAQAQGTDSSTAETTTAGQASDTGQASDIGGTSNAAQVQGTDSSTAGTSYYSAASDATRTSKAERAKEEAAVIKDAEDALKIAREIIEEYIRKHPEDKDNKALRGQLEEAAYTIATMKLDVITTTVSSLVAVA